MMPFAKYIIRLDDACPTMLAENWCALESVFDELGIMPIVGVIPDNYDQALFCSHPDPNFWMRIRQWQEKGWEIAMHGLHHLLHPIPKACQSVLPLSDKSEFVGLSVFQQEQMLVRGYSIMVNAGVIPRAFMAPAHTFDAWTLHALRNVTDIRIITDGHALWPYEDDGFIWLPQQLWRYYDLPLGVWCICLHPNTMSKAELHRFISDIRRNASKFTATSRVLDKVKPRSLIDRSFSGLYRKALQAKREGARFL